MTMVSVPGSLPLSDGDTDAWTSSGLLDPGVTVGEALERTPASPADAAQTAQFSDFLLSGHLHKPALRLVYVPQAAVFTFFHIPAFPEGWQYRLFLTAGMTAGETVEALIEELGIRKVVVQGHKSARVEYCLRAGGSGGSSFRRYLSKSRELADSRFSSVGDDRDADSAAQPSAEGVR